MKTRIALFHGFGADSKSNWFPWLKTKLEKKDCEVYCPDLPSSSFPKLNEWLEAANKIPINEKTILIGHSLGTALILRILEKKKARAAFLVSSAVENPGISAIETFFKEPFNYIKIKQNCKHFYLFHSDNDVITPMSNAKKLEKQLGAKLFIFKEKGHLNMGTGYFEFRELFESLLEFIKY